MGGRRCRWRECAAAAHCPGGGVLCPTSITSDGCALTYVKFEYGGATTLPYTMYLLERTP